MTNSDTLRRLSNVIQALENVVTQCGGEDDFVEIEMLARVHIQECNARLRQVIHSR